jgi:hypothetical protein
VEVGQIVNLRAQAIPGSELWLHQPEAADRLHRAMVSMDQLHLQDHGLARWPAGDAAPDINHQIEVEPT